MARKTGKKVREINDFEEKGYAKSSKILLTYLRTYNLENIKIFKCGVSCTAGKKGSCKYSAFDLFGTKRFNYIYDLRYKKIFVDFLVGRFLYYNPNPDEGIRKCFTRILHYYGLHWEQCCNEEYR